MQPIEAHDIYERNTRFFIVDDIYSEILCEMLKCKDNKIYLKEDNSY